MAKVTKANMELRVATVTRALLAGHTRGHILRCFGDEWGVGIRQMDVYIKQATDEIREATSATADTTLAILTSNLWSLYRKHRKDSPGLARQTLMDIAKLYGLEKMNLTLKLDRPFEEASNEELAKAVFGGA